MEGRSLLRVILSALIGMGILVLVIVVIVKLFSGGGTKQTSGVDITDYANSASSVTLLIDGAPTQIDQDHRQVRITVTQNQNQIEIMQGYQGNVMASRNYPNNQEAYGTFLQALKLMNFSKGNKDKAAADYRGYCPFGSRYVFTFNDGQTDAFSYWATSCRSGGTYQGNLTNTLRLIKLQIPQAEYNQLTNSVATGA